MRINFDSNYNDIKKILRSYDNLNSISNKNSNKKELSLNNTLNNTFDNTFNNTLQDVLTNDENLIKTSANNMKQDSIQNNAKGSSCAKTKLSFIENDINEQNLFTLNLEDFELEKADILNSKVKFNNHYNVLENSFRNDIDDFDSDFDNDFDNENNVKTPTIVSAKRISSDNNLSLNNNFKANVNRIDKKIISKIIKDEGKRQGIDPALALAVAKVESSMNPMAVSTDGHYSKGLFQLLDNTGKELMANFANYEHYSPYDIEQNSTLGINYLRELHQTFSKVNTLSNNATTNIALDADSLEKFAIAAFNAGQGRVASAQEKALRDGKDPRVFENVYEYLPNITKDYVRKVLATRDEFSRNI
ncbi:MAG: lytic transglycosylase domain-containing protein [Bdellovibrionota bacterium]